MPDTVATPSAAYLRAEELRRLPRDLMGGTPFMRVGSTLYLLKFTSELDADYSVRLADSFLSPFFSEAVYGIVGRMFAEPLVLSDDTPERVKALWDDIDLSTTQADVFLYRAMIDAVVSGISWVLVDGPPGGTGRLPGGLRTVEEEIKDNSRPFWKNYLAQDVIDVVVVFDNGVPRIERARVLVKVEEPDGKFGAKTVERVIVYRRGDASLTDPGRNVFPLDPANAYFASFETHQKSVAKDGAETWSVMPKLSGRFLPPRTASDDLRKRFVNLPLVPFITKKTGHFAGEPPLAQLADLCLQHWRKKSRLDAIIDNINTPVLKVQATRADFEGANTITTDTTKTAQQREFRIGPNAILFTGGENRDITWLEHQGTSIQVGLEDLRSLEQQIRQAASDPFERRPTGNETATAQLLAEQRPRTQAQVWATLAESSADECLEWTSAWLGEEGVGSVSFGKRAMASLGGESFAQVLALWDKGELSSDQLRHEARRYGVLDPDTREPAGPRVVEEPAGPKAVEDEGAA